MKELEEIRKEIDKLDGKIKTLFLERLSLCEKVAKIKGQSGTPIFDGKRENKIVENLTKNLTTREKEYIKKLYATIFDISKDCQSKVLSENVAEKQQKKYCLVGEKLSHSYSKEIHTLRGFDYDIKELSQSELKDFIYSSAYSGFNVTMPYKKAVISFCDELSNDAREIKSINTIKKDNGKIFGYNTDILGIEYTMHRLHESFCGKNVLVCGSGGAGQTALYCAKKNSAKSVNIVSRSGEINYENCYEYKDTEIIINATLVGMYPNIYDSPINLERFDNIKAVIDFVYNPLNTRLILQAKSLGIPCASGLYMLCEQALCAEDIWQNKKHTTEETREIVFAILKAKCNIVLCGMPSAGKTTIGRQVAKELKREFIDIDNEIEKLTGRTTANIIEEKGESYFREIESGIIKNVAKKNGTVIALGGGSVIEEENVIVLRQNGIIVWLKRDLKLLNIENRPLSSQKGVEQLYRERKKLYCRAADSEIENNDSIEKIAKGVIERYEDTCYKRA